MPELGIPPRVLVFDFDGVILESVNVKDEAFQDLFPDATDQERQAVLDFHIANPGIHRRIKIERILTEVLGRPADEGAVVAALARFRCTVWNRLMECPEVPGVREFLEARGHLPKYVVSASPHEELRGLMQARDLSRYFRDVLGSPPSKAELLRQIIKQEGVSAGELVMYGDKITDLQAAEQVGACFVGRHVAGEESTFPADVQLIDSF